MSDRPAKEVRIAPIRARDIPPRTKPSNYPAPFAAKMTGRQKRALGDAFGLSRFGVNLTTLDPGAQSALLHRHTRQEEFVYILEGAPTLCTDQGDHELTPGMCVGFPANGIAHHLVNRTAEPVVYLEIGDRDPSDTGEYPQDDLVASYSPAGWRFTHKDGTPW
ncbi:MAG TPA: cupin domain-containing protein [Pseudolabrys sp.]|nr:cupin domain-containing protein [Pseudolabrys sp.]